MRTLRWALIAAFTVLVSCGGGSSSSDSEASLSPTDGGSEVAYNVGDTGPGGGIIVYVDEAGFDNSSGDDTSIGAMCLTGTCNYLEMAPTDLEGRYSWDEAIVAAEAFSTLSADDWLLPSKDALNVIYEFVILDDFSADYYWTSSKTADNTVWLQDFTPGGKYLYPQASSSYYVRPVRAF